MRSLGGLPTYWSKSPKLRLASQIEPSEEEKELEATPYIREFSAGDRLSEPDSTRRSTGASNDDSPAGNGGSL